MAPTNHSPADARRLADAIAVRRARLGLNQEALAARGGPSGRTVRDIENARLDRFTPSTLSKLDRALDWRDGTSEKILDGTATEAELAEVVARAGHASGTGTAYDASVVTGPITGHDADGPVQFTRFQVDTESVAEQVHAALSAKLSASVAIAQMADSEMLAVVLQRAFQRPDDPVWQKLVPSLLEAVQTLARRVSAPRSGDSSG